MGTLRPWEEPYATRFAKRIPRVYIGFVAYGDIAPEVFQSTMQWCFQAGVRYKGVFEIAWDQEPFAKKEQYRARNSMALAAQKAGADFLLTLDDDHTIGDCPDMLGHFFRQEQPLQGGLYVQRTDEFEQPVICKNIGGEKYGFCSYEELPAYPGGPVEILGGGVNWIDCRLLDFMYEPHWWPANTKPDEKHPQVIFLPDMKYGLDLQLCLKAKTLGVTPWLNLDVQIGHVIHGRTVIRPRGKEGYVVCPRCQGIATHEKDRWICQICNSELKAA